MLVPEAAALVTSHQYGNTVCVPLNLQVHICAVCRGHFSGLLLASGSSWRSPSTLCKMLLWWCWAQRQANHSSLSIFRFSLWHSLPCHSNRHSAYAHSVRVSAWHFVRACGQRRTLFNKSTSVVPDCDKRAMSTMYPMCLLWMALTDWRETVRACCHGSDVTTAYCYILSSRAK